MQDTQEYRDFVVGKLAKLEQLITDTLNQALKTNGRVTKVEDRLDGHDIILAVTKSEKGRWDWWRDMFGRAVIPMLCTALGFGLLLSLVRLNIVDVSVVSTDIYDSSPE